jgi:CRISPR system Cascade subunit CasB
LSEVLELPVASDGPAAIEKLGSVVRRWWVMLDERRGDRADLRRARTPSAVAFLPAYHRLVLDLRRAGIRIDPERTAVIAGVLSHVERDDASRSFAKQAASEHNGKARLSGLRFRRLLAVDDLGELQTSLVRTIRLLDSAASVSNLAESIRWWNDRTKKQWASDYYETAPNED